MTIFTKEEADHSLPYMVAVALLDGRLMPAQYFPERILKADIQELLRRVIVREDAGFSRRFPEEMACRIRSRPRRSTRGRRTSDGGYGPTRAGGEM